MIDEFAACERRPIRSRFNIWILAAPIFIGIALFVIGAYRAYILRIPQVPFDQGRWKGADAEGGVDRAINSGARQAMMRDLLTNHLPGMNRRQIEEILGASWSHEQARFPEFESEMIRDEKGGEDCARCAEYFFKDYDWDLLYDIGYERIFIWDHRWRLHPDPEYLIIRLGQDGSFDSWYVVGSERWPRIVGRDAASDCRERRNVKGERKSCEIEIP